MDGAVIRQVEEAFNRGINRTAVILDRFDDDSYTLDAQIALSPMVPVGQREEFKILSGSHDSIFWMQLGERAGHQFRDMLVENAYDMSTIDNRTGRDKPPTKSIEAPRDPNLLIDTISSTMDDLFSQDGRYLMLIGETANGLLSEFLPEYDGCTIDVLTNTFGNMECHPSGIVEPQEFAIMTLESTRGTISSNRQNGQFSGEPAMNRETRGIVFPMGGSLRMDSGSPLLRYCLVQ